MKTRIKPADVIAALNASNDAHAAERAAFEVLRNAKRDARESRFEAPDWRADIIAADTAYCEAYTAYRDADAEYMALRNAHKVQVENAVKRALSARAEEYAEKPSHWKRTKDAVAAIVAEGCDISPDRVAVYKDERTGGLTVRVYSGPATETAEVDVYGDYFKGTVGTVEALHNWLRPMQGADGLTVKRVKELARRRRADIERLAKGAEAYRQSVRKVIDRYRAIDPTDDLRNAATVRF